MGLFYQVKSSISISALDLYAEFYIASHQMDGLSDVSGCAHIGGSLAGVLAWFTWRACSGASELQRQL
jgi:membrane associated rhomboid family serine protease